MPPPQVLLQGLQLPQGPQESLCRLTLGAWRKRHAEECESLRAPRQGHWGSPEGPCLNTFPFLTLGAKPFKDSGHPKHSFTESASFPHKGSGALHALAP